MKAILLLLMCALPAMAGIIKIKNKSGREINARILTIVGDKVTFQVDGNQDKVFTLSLLELDEESVKAAQAEVAALKKAGLSDLIGCKVVANSLATGRDEEKRYEASWGSYDKSVYKGRTLKAVVTASAGDKCKVRILWIGRDLESKTEGVALEELLDAVPNGEPLMSSALFVEDEAKYVALGTHDKSGIKYVGWVIAVEDSAGKVVATAASKPSLLDHLKKTLTP